MSICADTMKRWIWLRGNPATGGDGASWQTVTGSTPLALPGSVGKPLKRCEMAIEAVQSGTGDPSPENVRPISGWTGATITIGDNPNSGISVAVEFPAMGENLCYEAESHLFPRTNGAITDNTTYTAYAKVNKNTDYVFISDGGETRHIPFGFTEKPVVGSTSVAGRKNAPSLTSGAYSFTTVTSIY